MNHRSTSQKHRRLLNREKQQSAEAAMECGHISGRQQVVKHTAWQFTRES